MLLRSYSFPNHLGLKQQTIEFCPNNFKTNNNYISVVIGPNGCGKSSILRDIANIFRESYDCKSYTKIKFMVDYNCNGNNQLIQKTNTRYFQNENGEDHCDFPKRVVAVSLNSTDKFPFSKVLGSYRYAGGRSSNNNAGTKTITKQLIELLAEFDYEKFKVLKPLLQTLDFEEEFIINYPIKSLKIQKKLTSLQEFMKYFKGWDKREGSNRKTMPFSTSHFLKMNQKEVEDSFIFLQNMPKKICYDIFNENEFSQFKDNFQLLKHLYKLDLIKTAEIKLKKKNNPNYELKENDLSSGEYNLIFQYLKILLHIENDSLLLIDEPETSLHPNWQMKYIPLLVKAIEPFRDIHVIIATHSNLLLSNLTPENCSIITVSAEGEFELLDYSVSGWSPENILYRAFGVTGHRNSDFEYDVRRLIHFIENKNASKMGIESILKSLERYVLTDSDPLKKVISEAKEKLRND